MTTELFVGAYLTRTSGRTFRITRIAGSRTYRGYLDGEVVIEGSRAEVMRAYRGAA